MRLILNFFSSLLLIIKQPMNENLVDKVTSFTATKMNFQIWYTMKLNASCQMLQVPSILSVLLDLHFDRDTQDHHRQYQFLCVYILHEKMC